MMLLEPKEPLKAKPCVYCLKTPERFEAIVKAIKAHKKTIAYLEAVAKGKIDLRKTGCTPAIRRYQRTREDEARLPRTLHNLHRHIELLNVEQEVLKRYGR